MKESLTPYKMCLNKVSYSSKQEATNELDYWTKVGKANEDIGFKVNTKVKVYKCAFCSKWHLGNLKRR